MDNSFFAYLQQLELMAFFSSYPLIYAATLVIAGHKKHSKNNCNIRMVFLLPFAYALVGSLYLGLQLKNLYPDYSIENIAQIIQQPALTAWGLLSILFWIPALGKKPVLSLLHSLVIFFFLVRDIFLHSFHLSPGNDIVRNDMKIYTDSLLLNLGALLLVILISLLITRFKKQ